MTTVQATTTGTLLDAVLASVHKAADHNRDDAVAPAAILWPDEKREWERLVPRLRVTLPHFLVFGPYDKANRTGPAIWLRCVLAGKVPDVAWPPGTVPILYLPGISRATLRATEECPPELKPLAELQYFGVFWSQQNGKDWTVTAFLQTDHGGLQLKIAKDQATATAIRRSIEKLVDVPVAELEAKSTSGELNSNYFHLLISDDPVDDLLTWLSDPEGTRKRWESDRWETMCSDAHKNYGFDPVHDGPLVGAEHLGLQAKTAWKTAWKRFAAAPSRYAGLIEQLRRARPKPKEGTLFDQEEFWPQDNEAAEAKLRQSLLDLASASVLEARKTILELEKDHKHRREWVWARLNLAPLAIALLQLAKLADVTKTPLAGATTGDMVKIYTESGWQADAASLDALAFLTHPQDREAVCEAIAKVYTPWLRDAAELFQQRVKQEPLPGRELPRLADVPSGTCVLFTDGLRFDVGEKLRAALEAKFGPTQVRHQFVALPSVTPTSKPAVSPVAGKIKGTTAGEEFRPCVALDEKDLTPDRFRKLLEDDGYQVLGPDDVGESKGRAWAEFGNVDKTGHEEGIGLARRIPELIVSLVHRVEALLAAGWREVRIVTDHGWLLLPKGLPKTDLPKYLTATRWGRCAVVKTTATVELTCFSWFWAEDVRIACPPGVDCFIAGKEYSHGGLSLQECLVPQLTIQAAKKASVTAKIESYKWSGLRCRVKLDGQFDGCKVDLRDNAADPATSLAEAVKAAGKDGTVSVVVKADKDAREGTASLLVLLDPADNVLEMTPVKVGG
jgi:hypothetical protein